MYNRMHEFTREQIQMIHDASMDVLQNTGIKFNEPQALAIFKQHGIKVDGEVVFLTEADVLKAMETIPSRFIIHARNPENHVTIGDDDFVFVPGYGAPFIMEPDGTPRPGTLNDYENLTRLADALSNTDMSGHMLVEPSDVPPELAYLFTLRASMLNSSKPFMGITAGLLAGVTHFVRFIISPLADPALCKVIGMLVLLSSVSAYLVVVFLIWSLRKTGEK